MRHQRASSVVAFIAVLLLPAARGQETEQPPVPRGVPDHYGALNTYAEGEILEVQEGGHVLLLAVPRPGGSLFEPRRAGPGEVGGGRPDPRAGTGPGRRDDLLDVGRMVVLLRYAKGWVFVDDPDGGAQRRVRLDDGGRELFAEGLLFQVGPAPGLTSNAVDSAAATRTWGFGTVTTTGTLPVKAVEGWVYVRLTPYRERR